MREITFRAWDSQEKVMTIVRGMNGWINAFADAEYSCRSNMSHVIDRFIWLQYTGLKDKNGVQIYDGDIIEVANGDNSPICKVEWLLGQWCLMDEVGGSWTRQLYHQPDRLEIKGNIFEHKNLLEK